MSTHSWCYQANKLSSKAATVVSNYAQVAQQVQLQGTKGMSTHCTGDIELHLVRYNNNMKELYQTTIY